MAAHDAEPRSSSRRRGPAAESRGAAEFRFHGPLNDFLPPDRRGKVFRHDFRGRNAVKDMIEALGVPHPEVDAILIDGRAAAFTRLVPDGARIEVHPDAVAAGLRSLQPPPLRRARFVLDGHLGKLARDLRLLGFDTLYRNDYHDAELAQVSRAQRRILLTRDVGLLKRAEVRRGLCLRETDPWRQLLEVLRRLALGAQLRPFSRCIACNGPLRDVSPRRLEGRVKPEILAGHARFRACRDCGRVYWPGSHYDRLLARVAAVRAASAQAC